ncbi:MAG: hypothetical protein HQK49_17835 [Oligoflexia bacterium]|nr:hypothetical protein [Oligoflexia bacterium]
MRSTIKSSTSRTNKTVVLVVVVIALLVIGSIINTKQILASEEQKIEEQNKDKISSKNNDSCSPPVVNVSDVNTVSKVNKVVEDITNAFTTLNNYLIEIDVKNDVKNKDKKNTSEYLPLGEAIKRNLINFDDAVKLISSGHTGEVITLKAGGTDVKKISEKEVPNVLTGLVPTYIDNFLVWHSPPSRSGKVSSKPDTKMDFSYLKLSSPFALTLSGNLGHSLSSTSNTSGSIGIDNKTFDIGISHTDNGNKTGMWFSGTPGWYGAGLDYTHNLEDGQLWATSEGGAFRIGASVAGAKDFLGVGGNAKMILPSGAELGIGGYISISKDRAVKYLGPYPKDGPNKALKDLHLIEITDRSKNGGRIDLTAGLDTNYVSVDAGVRASANEGHKDIHRFYVSLDKVQEAIKEADDTPGVLRILGLGKKLENIPDIDNPHLWHVGEEVIVSNEKSMSGAFVLGVSTAKGLVNVKAGLAGTVSGFFDVAVRKIEGKEGDQSGTKIEVSISPKKITEIGAFVEFLKFLSLSGAKDVALALRQSFVFDFSNPKARLAYRKLIEDGVLPNGILSDPKIIGDREAEHLLDSVKKEELILNKIGVKRTYLEKIDIPSYKFFAGIVLPIVTYIKKWAGLSISLLKANAKVVATNGEIAVSRETEQFEKTVEKLFMGTQTKGVYATSRRNHKKGDSNKNEEHIWGFGGLVLQAQINDNNVLLNSHNSVRQSINNYFNTSFSEFKHLGHGQGINITIERKLGAEDLEKLVQKGHQHVSFAHSKTNIPRNMLHKLITDLESRGNDQRAEILRKFFDNVSNLENIIKGHSGIKAFGAIHLLLGGDERDLTIKITSTSQSKPVEDAKLLAVKWAGHGDRKSKIVPQNDSKTIKKFYKDVRKTLADIEQGLKDVEDDPYLVGDNDLLKDVSANRESKLTRRNALISARETLLGMLDLDKQKVSLKDQAKIYKKLSKRNLNIKQRLVLLQNKYEETINYNNSEKRNSIIKRYDKVIALLKSIKDEEKKINADPLMNKVYHQEYKKRLLSELNNNKQDALKLISLSSLKDDFSDEDRDELLVLKEKMTANRLWGLVGPSLKANKISSLIDVEREKRWKIVKANRSNYLGNKSKDDDKEDDGNNGNSNESDNESDNDGDKFFDVVDN